MRISSLLNEDGILLKSKPKSKEEVINTLVECHFRLGNLNDKDSFRKAVLEREARYKHWHWWWYGYSPRYDRSS